MDSTINSRVASLIKALKMSNNAFAKSIGKTSTTINFIVDGRSKPGFEILESICELYRTVNPTWLITGEGKMFLEETHSTTANVAPDQYLQDHVKQLESSFTQLAQQLAVKDRQLDIKDRQIEKLMDLLGKLRPAPYLSKVIDFHPETSQAVA